MLDTFFGVVGLLFLAAAVVAPCIEVFSEHRWPRTTLLPSCIAIVLAFLFFSAAQ